MSVDASKKLPSEDTWEDIDEPYVNHGLLRWEKAREEWLSGKDRRPVGRRRARTMDVDQVIDDLFSGRGGDGSLPKAVPLPQMLDLLVDLWEAEGLFN